MICSLCGHKIENYEAEYYYDEEEKKIKTRHRDKSCENKPSGYCYMKRIGQVKHD